MECKRYQNGESYVTTMSWIRARVSFALLRLALLCLRGPGAKRRIHLVDVSSEIILVFHHLVFKYYNIYLIVGH